MAASTTPEVALGWTLKYDTVGGSTFATSIAKIRNIDGEELSCENIDVSAADDTFQKMLAGIDLATVRRIDLVYTEAVMEALYALYKVEKEWQVSAPGGGKIQWSGYICKIGRPMAYRGEVRAMCEIMPTEALTVVAN